MNNKEFDHIIKEKLSQVESIDTTPDWDVFSEILKSETSFGDLNFDESIKDKLSNIDAQNAPADWKVFSEILKSDTDFNNLEFDNQVSEKLNQHHSSFNSEHWLILQKRLKKEENIRKHLITSKAVEILCIFLLLFTLDNLVFENNDVIYDNNAYAEILNQKNLKAAAQAAAVLEVNASQNSNGVKTIIVDERVRHSDFANRNTFAGKPAFFVSKEQNESLENSSQLAEYSNADISKTLLSVFFPERKSEVALVKERNNIGDIANIDMNEMLLSKNVIRPMVLPSFKPKLNKYEIKYHLTPTFAMGPGVNRSPFDEVYDQEAYRSVTNSTKTGVLFSAEHKHFEFSTGFEVERRSYAPQVHKEPFNSPSEGNNIYSLKNIGLSTGSVPLGVKYSLPISENTKLYATGSLGINMVLSSKYDTEKLRIEQPVRGGTASRSNEPKLYSKDFTPGLLQGGDFADNLFLTANAEIGFENKISEKQSIVTGIGYNRFIHKDGFGPNNDRFDFAFARVGIKYQLN